MTTNNSQVFTALRDLYRIAEAGEKGYATAAINASNRGVKFLFKSYAQQRANFKIELLSEIERLEGSFIPSSSILGMIHRGRVAIFSAMIIEDDKRERVILKEVALGEKYAAQTYQKALTAALQPETRQLVERQFEEVQHVIEEVRQLRGEGGKQMLVRQFNTETDAERTVQSLQSAGFSPSAVEKVALNQPNELYSSKGTTVRETVLSGMFGGVVWGSLIGVLAALGAGPITVPAWIGIDSVAVLRVLIALGVIFAAALVGGLIGLVIGKGIAEQDSYEYNQSTLPGRFLLKAVVESSRSQEVNALLNQQTHRQAQSGIGVST